MSTGHLRYRREAKRICRNRTLVLDLIDVEAWVRQVSVIVNGGPRLEVCAELFRGIDMTLGRELEVSLGELVETVLLGHLNQVRHEAVVQTKRFLIFDSIINGR